MKLTFICVLICLLSASCVEAQKDAPWKTPPPASYPFIKPARNKIINPDALQPLFEKLSRLQDFAERDTSAGVVRIVHIGDSHIQADMLTSVVRQAFQAHFGNAGRGIVFPYGIAHSNGPADVYSSSNVSWQANRLAHPEIPVTCGLSGFGMHTNRPDAWLRIGIRGGNEAGFNRVQLFLAPGEGCASIMAVPGARPLTAGLRADMATASLYASLPESETEITLSACPGRPAFSLYGISLERANKPGVLYHTIGVNGAQYSQYNTTPLFWKQLPALAADCYIISMGTNEAQAIKLNEAAFIAQCRLMIRKLREAAPDAAIILTTPAGSYTAAGRPNAVLGSVRDALLRVCREEHAACWDLYGCTSGYMGAAGWRQAGLMSHDLVHYNAQGYQVQGRLLLEALSGAYNAWLEGLKK